MPTYTPPIRIIRSTIVDRVQADPDVALVPPYQLPPPSGGSPAPAGVR